MSNHRERLGYLLKHAYLAYTALIEQVLAPYGIEGREFAVLLVFDDAVPLSQQEAARRLTIDRTTMVAFVDALESKRLVERRPDPADRRRNIVSLTDDGRRLLAEATTAADEAERRFLAPLGPDSTRFTADLARIIEAFEGH
ncbi:MarR family winged helix-turn-helix transcriptional regulator [Jiangella asiatica]|uniref:MarR family transcriptional regulator n=1 Tax=Jiangella asiatica TaxID=2530372 RepID=A0A4R5CXE8_9ACTN|nr:MarR family transcriptional regulator [Jiangella asiatica]TDE02595.1 MarR family transcriptional regulator [Jiangella asiatica]